MSCTSSGQSAIIIAPIIHLSSPRPIAILHSKEDLLIPYKHSEALFEKIAHQENAKLFISEVGVHTGLFDACKEAFEDQCVIFFPLNTHLMCAACAS
jgi:fermentation-respiration switch protein FrsA (DUF1100 family)